MKNVLKFSLIIVGIRIILNGPLWVGALIPPDFDPDWDYTELSYTAKENGVANFKIGLDEIYRFS